MKPAARSGPAPADISRRPSSYRGSVQAKAGNDSMDVMTIVPPHVREGLFSRTADNDAVVARMRKPMLLTWGEDQIVLPSMGQYIADIAKHAQLSLYPNVGHAPFWEAAPRFNEELKGFVTACN